MMSSRIAINILLFISILYFPWWLTIMIGILLLVMHPATELLFWGIFADSLYGTMLSHYFNIQYLFTISFFALILVALWAKRKMIFYN